MHYFHIFNLNMNEWVLVKGRIEVVLSNWCPRIIGTGPGLRLRCEMT